MLHYVINFMLETDNDAPNMLDKNSFIQTESITLPYVQFARLVTSLVQ
jgi:hypothetical protein